MTQLKQDIAELRAMARTIDSVLSTDIIGMKNEGGELGRRLNTIADRLETYAADTARMSPTVQIPLGKVT